MLINGFYEACNSIDASYLKVDNESISVICSWTTEKGVLPHLSYVFRNTELLGTKFKTVACSVNDAFLFIDIDRGKLDTNKSKYHM